MLNHLREMLLTDPPKLAWRFQTTIQALRENSGLVNHLVCSLQASNVYDIVVMLCGLEGLRDHSELDCLMVP